MILLVGLVALVVFAMGVTQKKPFTKGARIVGAAFAGLMHLQVVIGLVMTVMGLYTPRAIGHLVLMLAAAVFAQVMLSKNRRQATPGHRLPLIGVSGALVLIAVGLLAIGRMPWTMTTFGS